MTDPILDAYVELEDIGRRLAALKHELGKLVGMRLTDDARQRILDAVRESDEHTARMGREAPNDLGVAPGYETLTHTVALDEDDVEHIDSCGE